MAIAAMSVERQLPQEQQHDERGQEGADDQVLLHRVHGGLDVLRLVADDLACA